MKTLIAIESILTYVPQAFVKYNTNVPHLSGIRIYRRVGSLSLALFTYDKVGCPLNVVAR